MKIAVAVMILGVALGACSGREYLAVNSDRDRTALPHRDMSLAPVGVVSDSHDRCGAAALQYLIGKQKTEIPVANDPNRRRVICTTCPMTKDVRPDRQTILYDEASKAVTSVTCG